MPADTDGFKRLIFVSVVSWDVMCDVIRSCEILVGLARFHFCEGWGYLLVIFFLSKQYSYKNNYLFKIWQKIRKLIICSTVKKLVLFRKMKDNKRVLNYWVITAKMFFRGKMRFILTTDVSTKIKNSKSY